LCYLGYPRDQRNQRGNYRGEFGNYRGERGNRGNYRGERGNYRGERGGDRGNYRGERGNYRGERGNYRGERGNYRGERGNRGGERGQRGRNRDDTKPIEHASENSSDTSNSNNIFVYCMHISSVTFFHKFAYSRLQINKKMMISSRNHKRKNMFNMITKIGKAVLVRLKYFTHSYS
jgi:hypothetical protein